MNKRKVKRLIAIISVITIAGIGMIACDKVDEKGQDNVLSNEMISEDEVKEVRIKDNNIYENGVDGIFKVLDKKLDLPEKLYMHNDFVLNFDSKGNIISFNTSVYGVNKNGILKSYDINYDEKISNNIKVTIVDGEGVNYDESKLIEPLKLIAKNSDLDTIANKWDSESYELVYQGKQMLYNDGTNKFIDQVGNKLDMKEKEYLIDGYGFSVCVPDKKAELGTVTYGTVIKEIESPSEDSIEEKLLDGEFETQTKDGIKYRLKITDAAAGARAYRLDKSEDDGENWDVINEEVFERLGVGTGLFFVDNNIGFTTLANKGGTQTEIFKTVDGGKTFEVLKLPDRALSGISNADEIFDTPEVPVQEDGALSICIGQGSDGDYNKGSKLKFISSDLGGTWKFSREVE